MMQQGVPFKFRCTKKIDHKLINCDMEAEYLVWFEGFGGLYTYLCSDHLSEYLTHRGYRVVAAKHIKEAIEDRNTPVAP